MGPQVDIRPATPADVRALVTLVEQYWKFEAIEGFDATRIAALFERVAVQPTLGHAWLATVDGTPAGYLFAVYVFSLEYQGLTAEIDELYVTPQHRRLGLGARLLSTAECTFREGGCTVAFLQIGRDNAAARAFYRGHGYADRAGFELVDKVL
ncbi:MAG TPA: GNAT family N-acetyltransferase [Steroidobacteraceae bacterium]|jgi:GNAT superfamily N-acetyltransferase|nr:GNAT family N-acetyltransferase [Steroidobacteraceae bacterium]